MANAHHLAVVCARRDLELVGDARRGERVVAADLESLRQPAKDAAAVVLDDTRLPVEQTLRAADLAAEGLDDRLVAEADAERRDARLAHQLEQLRRRSPRAGREDEVRRRHAAVQLIRPA